MKLLNVALIAGGGYFVLKYLGIDLLSMVSGSGDGSGTGVTPTIIGANPNPAVQSTPQANGPITTTDSTTTSAILSMVAAQGYTPANGWDGLFNVDQWNSFYAAVRSVPGPAPEDIGFRGATRGKRVTFNEYWSAMTAGGFSGLYTYHGMEGMGLVARMNPWLNHYTPGPGRTILPLGSETFIRRFGGN